MDKKATMKRSGGQCLKLGLLLVFSVVVSSGCVPRAGAPAGTPVPDPTAAAAELQRGSIPAGPRQAAFEWSLNEAGSRLSGRGVARFEAPERLRLDLFGPRGETYLSGALVGDEFRVPTGAAGSVSLPSPTLLWGALGVVRPPSGAELLDAVATDEGTLVVRYRSAGGDTFEYHAAAAGAAPLLTRVARPARGGVHEDLQLTRHAGGELASTRYRDLAAYRELVLTFESVTDATSFPPNIWSP
ncbi:hypothetical protein BH23GEM3_BH23GEM3_26650 [soil metagenome]|nr:hypothetical protein [Gemmatimonadota bacterium]